MKKIRIKEKTRRVLGIVLFTAFLAAFIYGMLFTGEVDTVFAKASKICLECIGIG